MDETIELLKDPETVCLCIPIKKKNAFGCDTVEDYIYKIIAPIYSKRGKKIDIIATSESELYSNAMDKTMEMAKSKELGVEVESDETKSLRFFQKKVEEGKLIESISFIRVVRVLDA